MDSMDEQRLIAGCKRGELWARKEVYEQYSPVMLSLCMRYVVDNEVVKDLLQDGFVKVFTRIDQFADKGSFGGWIRQVFVNASLEYLRKQKSLQLNVRMDDLEDEESLDSLSDDITANDLLECIAELPNGLRTVFNLYAIEGYSHSEIAKMLRIQEGSSRSQFARARQLLQKKVLNLLKNDHAGKR